MLRLITAHALQVRMADLRKGLIYACAFLGTLASNAVLALIPELRGYFSATTSEVLLSISFFMVFFAFFSLFTGSISDLIGRKKVLLIGLIIYSIGCAFTALSDALPLFYASRAVQGLGFAFVQPVLVAVLGDIVGPGDEGRTMGWMTAATASGITLGPLLAGYAAAIDWRLAFVIIAIATIALAALVFAFVRLPTIGKKGFSVRSLRRNMVTAGRRRAVVMLALTGFLHMLIWIGTQAFASDSMGQGPFFATPIVIGEVLAFAGFCSIVASRVGGGMVDRYGRYRPILLGNSLMISSMLAMAFFTPTVVAYAIFLAIFSIGSAISWASYLTLTVELLPSLRGTVSSMFTSLGFVGGALAPIVLAPVQTSFGTSGVHLVTAGICSLIFLTTSLVRKDGSSGKSSSNS
jgi:ACDE family multidrug resistance protein